MNFNSVTFLFVFLPLFFIFYYLAATRLRKVLLLAASLLFYILGQPVYFPMILGIVLVNFFLARRIEMAGEDKSRYALTIVGVVVNLALLVGFKVFTTYGADALPSFGFPIPERVSNLLNNLVYPLGLSFISFQTIAYLVDVYKNRCGSEKNILDFALYIFLFPKMLVGPITLYRSIAGQLKVHLLTAEDAANGIRRFIIGFAKKVLIADLLAGIVDSVFSLDPAHFSTGFAWLALMAYALQIYFDFSGYVDMAIGLAQMLGFRLPENFDFPYISKSISEFWRRWHITLSSWFRDYVFYPLERKRLKWIGQPLNVLIVFLLTGLWHGLTRRFAIWGLIHGVAIVFELSWLGRKFKSVWAPFQHLYALAVILFSWVFFRSKSLPYAMSFLARLAGFGGQIAPLPFSRTAPLPIINHSFWLAFAAGLIFSTPLVPELCKRLSRLVEQRPHLALPLRLAGDVLLFVLLLASIAATASSSFAPTIYGKF